MTYTPRNSVALLPTGRPNMDPLYPESHWLAEHNSITEIWRNEKGNLSIVLDHGSKLTQPIGTKIIAHHDQAGYTFGELTLVGLRNYRTGESLGEIPVGRRLTVRVYK